MFEFVLRPLFVIGLKQRDDNFEACALQTVFLDSYSMLLLLKLCSC